MMSEKKQETERDVLQSGVAVCFGMARKGAEYVRHPERGFADMFSTTSRLLSPPAQRDDLGQVFSGYFAQWSNEAADWLQRFQEAGQPEDMEEAESSHEVEKGVLDLLVQTRQQTRATTVELSQVQLDFRPDESSWSIGEIVDHVILGMSLFSQEMEELVELARKGDGSATLTRTLEEVDFSTPLFPQALLAAMGPPLQFVSSMVPENLRDLLLANRVIPFRAAREVRPSSGRKKADLLAELDASVARVLELVEQNGDLDFRRLQHRHPLLGTNDLLDLVRVTALHERRHLKQIEEVRKRHDFPL